MKRLLTARGELLDVAVLLSASDYVELLSVHI